jgi:hypothetical protein
MKQIDITSFNAIKDSEQGYDLEMKTPDGQDTGIIFTILGKYAEPVQKWSKKVFTEYQRDLDIAKRKGKEPEQKSIDELRAQNIEGAIVRVIGWKNVKQEFSAELLQTVLVNNPHFVDQIVEESDNAGNFTKAL